MRCDRGGGGSDVGVWGQATPDAPTRPDLAQAGVGTQRALARGPPPYTTHSTANRPTFCYISHDSFDMLVM